MDDLQARVKRGAALLDEKRPGWAKEIALDRLAMRSCTQCILGQLWGSYFGGYEQLGRKLPSTFLFSSAEHGFTIPNQGQIEAGDAGGQAAVDALFADLWRAEIRARTEATT
jgi:hypothetical protein